METEIRTVARGWGRGNGELLFNGYRAYVENDKKVRDMNSDNGCMTMLIFLMSLTVHLKLVKVYIYLLSQLKKIKAMMVSQFV